MLKTKKLLKIIGEQLAEIIELNRCLDMADSYIANNKNNN